MSVSLLHVISHGSFIRALEPEVPMIVSRPGRKEKQLVSTRFSRPSLEIAVLTYQRPDALDKTLASIMDGGLKLLSKSFNVSVSVFDNDNSAEVYEVVKKYPRVTIVQHSRNLGLAGNYFHALKVTSKELIWIVADDDNLRFDWAKSFPANDGVGHYILKRTSRDDVEVNESILQRNIGLANNIFRAQDGKLGIRILESRGLTNTTYPQVLLAQTLESIPLERVAYQDTQPHKEYSFDGYLNVVFRDVLKLSASAKKLRCSRSRRAEFNRLSLSHILNYGADFLAENAPGHSKRKLRSLLSTESKGLPLIVQSACLLMRVLLSSSIRWPKVTKYLVVFGLRLMQRRSLASRVSSLDCDIPGKRGSYFDYEAA